MIANLTNVLWSIYEIENFRRRRPQTPRRRKNKIGANTIEDVTESFRSSGGRRKSRIN